MNELIEKKNIKIEDMIYEIRGRQVMLDSDLAKLYDCKNGTKEINQAVKNNISKFPERYSWVLTDDEILELWSKNLTAKTNKMSRVNPRVFTEHGVYMLSTILKSKTAVQITIKIMDTFVTMKHYLNDNKDIYKSLNNINNKIIEHDGKLDYIFSKFSLNGKLITDNNSLYIKSIFMDAKEKLIIIDPYLDDSIYSLIKDIKSNIILITSDKKKLTINKKNIRIIYNNTFHDRYIIIDKDNYFLVGASFKDIGNKTSTIIKIEDKFIRNDLTRVINNLLNF